MQEQEHLHNAEMAKWQSVLQIAVDLLRKVNVVCKKLAKDSDASSAGLLEELLFDTATVEEGADGGGLGNMLYGAGADEL